MQHESFRKLPAHEQKEQRDLFCEEVEEEFDIGPRKRRGRRKRRNTEHPCHTVRYNVDVDAKVYSARYAAELTECNVNWLM